MDFETICTESSTTDNMSMDDALYSAVTLYVHFSTHIVHLVDVL